jgi:ABC-type branched-subunit amino acid transport system substrate-binding protein
LKILQAATLVLLLATSACSDSSEPRDELSIVVNVPLQRSESIAQQIVNGARLAAGEINDRGGVQVGEARYDLRIDVVDSRLSPTATSENVRKAISRGAVAVIDEGTGVDAAWEVANEAGLPICITYQGGKKLIDLKSRPNVVRIAPTFRGMAFRLAEYAIPKGFRFAVLTDDSADGVGGEDALAEALSHTPEVVADRIRIPADATSVDVQVLQARRADATALLLWLRPAQMARVIRSARTSGWDVPAFASIAAEDPVLRQQLADHPEWLDNVTFAMSRLTSEKGPEPFQRFRSAYEDRYGQEDVGVKTRAGERVVQIPDWAMYPYDFVHVLAAAIERSGATGPSQALIDALAQVEVQGANGDERSFNEKSHEGVVDDDVFFARFEDMQWKPVEDDPLSSTLPALDQTE